MKTSAELCKMFMSGRDQATLSQKQRKWIMDVMSKEGNELYRRWDISSGWTIINDGEYLVRFREGNGGRATLTRISKIETTGA